MPIGRNVKSFEKETTNFHEKGKDYLGDSEMRTFLEASKKTRYPKRNYLLLLMIYRHGLRVSEAIALKKSDVNLKDSRIWINRLKGGLSTEHPISGDELRAIKRYLNSREDNLPWLFVNERGLPLTRQAVSYGYVHLEFEKNIYLSFSNEYNFRLDFIILSGDTSKNIEVTKFLSENVEDEIRRKTIDIYENSK